MTRISPLFIAMFLLVSGCVATEPTLGPDGKPLRKVYRIHENQAASVQFRMLDAVNALRQASALESVKLNAKLNAAASTHSRDMSIQNRPWHFGSDGSSPIDRVRRVGYDGKLVGETISETFETELETLAAWVDDPATRLVIMDPEARDMGFAWLQEFNGRIWWTLIMGHPNEQGTPPKDTSKNLSKLTLNSG